MALTTKLSPRLELSLKPTLLDVELRRLWKFDSVEFEFEQLFQCTNARPQITRSKPHHAAEPSLVLARGLAPPCSPWSEELQHGGH